MAAVRENRFFWCFTACSSAAALCSLFPHEGPCVEWLTQAFVLEVWGRYPEEVVWNHDGKRRRLCASLPVWVAQRSHHRPSKVSFVPRLCPRRLSQLWHSSACPSAPRCDFQLGMNPASPVPSLVGSAGALPATPHSTETPFKNSICMRLGVWSKRGGRLCKPSLNKDLLLLSVVNIDLTYFCYNSI